MRHKSLIFCAVAIIAAAAVPAFRYYKDRRVPNFSRDASIYVYPGADAGQVLQTIATEAQVRDIKSLQRSFKSIKVSEHLQSGHYRISKSHSSIYVARMLNNGWQSPVQLTLSGNLRIKSNIAAKISSQLLIDSASVYKALCDKELLASYGFTPANAFALLQPATYEIYWTAGIREILDKQKEQYDRFWTPEADDSAAKLGLSREQVATLASIVAAESNYAPEQPLIAGVYLNRLSLGMPLQADPTVAYCFDYKPSRILTRHLGVDSPYNTYRHTGLPPGPICVPTKESLQAVLNPDFGGTRGKGNLFFCANADFSGRHSFAKTLSEHNRNARAFQQELSRRSRLKKK